MLNTKDYNALSLAQPTNFKGMLNSGELLWGTGCRIPHPEAARVVAATPYHFCFLDAEHAPLNATLLVSLIRTIQYHSNGSMVPFVRIPRCSPELYNYALGAGAGGVVMPHVQNAKQAEELVRLCRFPPLGDRSFPPAALIGEQQNQTPEGKTTYDVWDEHAAIICQIEDLEGLENIDEICRVPGVDGLFVGTGDLRMCLELSHGSLDGDEPVFLSALRKIRDAAKANNLPIMGFGISPSGVELRREMGWNAFIIHGDIDAICTSAVQSLQTYNDAACGAGANGCRSAWEKNGEPVLSNLFKSPQMANLESQVKAIIAQQLKVPVDEVTTSANLKNGLATGDLRRSQLLTALRERFDIYITDEDMDEFTTTQDVIDYVGTKLWWSTSVPELFHLNHYTWHTLATMTVSPPTLPDDVLFSRLLKIATQRDSKIIVNDCSLGTQFSYRQILDGTVKLKEKLQALLDRSTLDSPGGFYIALLAPNGYEFIIGVLAVLAIGGVVVPIPTGALPAEASHILQQCDAQYLLATSELASLATQIKDEVKIPSLIIKSNKDADNNLLPVASYTLDPALAVSEETPSILFFTSGTTGPPKGVLHARRTINKYARQDEAPEPNDELCIIPRGAFWSIYFTKLFQMLLTGIRVEVHNFGRNYNLIWEKLREQTATKIVLSPTFWYGMMTYFQKHVSVELPQDVVGEYVKGAQHLRDACATGAMLSGRIKEFWREMRGGRPLKEQYGSTETQEISVCDTELGSVEDDLGTPLPNVIMKLSEGDKGEVLVKTPSLFLGYLNSPNATAKRLDPEGFFKTGDLAILQDGRYIFKGRANMDLFKFYTYKVPRGKVEAALTALPYVAEGYIMPVADPQCDTRTAALVRFHKNDNDIDDKRVDLQAIRNDLATNMGLPAYQLPTVLRVLGEHESVPRTWSDKTAMMKAVHMFFPLDSEDRICGEETEVLDVSDFMKMQTAKLWELSGMR
ncbi:hypothetical protein DL766_000305 [Monosporascus sp. MC13-8B]|uniref:Carrier domain-containing protein n=1 Tax=Monosporascus cannonballus TaxID=155416 RepID=A0ABY0H1N6_9PEZI|nr:hypothetical protein DL762_006565 [Monosporascus cannonballus]RYO86908.1 hypothetical protein DL763_006541 [Monosporascus cannonballus]RYP39643.1 hypothetical protein DL766_000305 [Monosporascus sp. MC13-8B]